MATFNPMAFKAQGQMKPTLMGGIGQGGLADTFASVFGMTWRETPVKGTFALWADGVQFTCRVMGNGGLDIGMYEYCTPKEFKAAFEAKCLEAPIYFQWTAEGTKTKYPYIFMIKKLQEINLWSALSGAKV